MDLSLTRSRNQGIKWLARTGFIAKGVVYVLLGVIAVMAAFHMGGQSSRDADKTGVFAFVKDGFGGNWLLPLLGAGLACYSAWRLIEAYHAFSARGKERWKGAVYFFSAIIHISLAVTAFRAGFGSSGGKKDSQQQFASELLSKPFGQWLLGIAALVIAGVGIYQIYYGLSEKYRKHVRGMNLHNNAGNVLLYAGKFGYAARGFVWLIIAYLFLRGAFRSSASQTGDTGKAFQFVQESTYGTYLLALLGLGLIAYGLFNFIRARYEEFNQEVR